MATKTNPAKNKKQKAGREARRALKIAKAHSPNLNRFYGYNLPPITPGAFEFHIELLRQKLKPMSLDRVAESIEWQDEQSALSGTLTLHRPDPLDPDGIPVVRGDEIRLRTTWEGKRYEVWTMRASAPQIQVDQGVVTVPLKDDLILLDANDMEWSYRKTKARPQGYTAREITVLVAKRLGLPTGEIVDATVKQGIHKRNASGRDVISEAWQREHQSTGKSYILRLRNRRVEVVEITRNPSIYVLGKQIQSAAISQKGGAKAPTTVLTGIGRVGKGKDAKKIKYTLADRKVVDLLGHVPATKHYGRVDSVAQLHTFVKRDLAAQLRLPDTIDLTVAGIPFILRGDGAQINLPAEGYQGQNSFVYCVAADHTVSGGQYTSDFTFGFTDPVVAELNAEAKAAAKRAAKAAKRNQKTTGSGESWLVTASAEDDPVGASGACRAIQSNGYSELSTNPNLPISELDFAALGHIPCMTALKITNPSNGRSVTAEKQDVGAGSSFLPVMGLYPATRSALGLDNSGQYSVVIERVDGAKLQPVRGTKRS